MIKYIPYILLIGMLFSCQDSIDKTIDNLADLPEPSIDSTLRVGDYRFVSSSIDSSYVEYCCSLEILKTTAESLDGLNILEVANFLATISGKCNDNVEFMEWSNELLFDVCERKPELVHELLSKNTSLDRQEILKQLRSPIKDELIIEEIILKFENIKPLQNENSKSWKLKILQAIKKKK